MAQESIQFDFNTAKPSGVNFDFNTAEPVGGSLRQTAFVEHTGEVVAAPEGFLDSIGRIWSGGYDKGNMGLELNNLYVRQMFGEKLDNNSKERMSALQKQLHKEIKTSGYHQEMLRALAEQTPQLLEMGHKSSVRSLQGGLVFGAGAAALGPSTPIAVPASTLVGMVVGGKLGFAEHSFLQNAGEAFGEFSNFRDKSGNKMDEDLARFGAFMVGAANAGLDFISFKAASKLFLGKNKLFNALSKNGKSIQVKSPKIMRRIIMDYANSVGTEVVTEALQEGIKEGGGELLKLISDQDFESKTIDNIIENIVAAGDEALKVSIPLAGIGAVGRGGVEATKSYVERTDRSSRKYKDVDTINKFNSAIEQVANNGIEGVDNSITSVIGRKVISGEQITGADKEIADDIILEAAESLSQQERELIGIAIREPRKAPDKEANIPVNDDIHNIHSDAIRAIDTLKKRQKDIDPELSKILRDKASLIRTERDRGVSSSLSSLRDSLRNIKKEFAKRNITLDVDTENKLKALNKRISSVKSTPVSLENKIKERTRLTRAKTKLRRILSKKSISPLKQEGKPKGKFSPEVHSMLQVLRDNILKKPDVATAELESRMSISSIPTPYEALANKSLVIASDGNITADDIEQFVEELETLISEGLITHKENVFARQEKIAGYQLNAATILKEGNDVNIIDETKFTNRVSRLANNARAVFDGWLFGWYDIPDIVFGKNQNLVEVLRVGKNITQEKSIVRRFNERLQSIGMNAFGFSNSYKFMKQMEADSELITVGDFINARGDKILLQMSKQEMRKLWMEYQDKSLRRTIFSKNGNAFTQEMVQAITMRLTQEDIAFARAQMMLYKDFYQEINAVYRRVYQVDLPFNEFYSPIRRKTDATFSSDGFMNEINYRRDVATGSLKSRVHNIRPLQQQADLMVFQRHIAELAHFIAFAEKIQDINGVFGNGGIRELIRKRHGESFLNIIDDYVDILVRNGKERSNIVNKIVNTFNRNFAVSVLGGKVALAAKQMTSFIAFWDGVPAPDFVAGVADFVSNPRKAIKILSKSELMRERGASIDRDIAAIGKAVEWKIFKKKQKIDEFLLLPTKFGDRGAIYLGGWAYYKYHRKQGLSHDEAISKFESLVATTQQSRDPDQLSLVQAGNPFMRTFTMFLSAPASYMRAEIRAIRHWKRNQISNKEFLKKIALYHFIIPSLFQYVANGFDWDEDEQLRAAIVGNLNGVFILGDILTSAVGSMFGKRYFPNEPNFAAWIRETSNGVADLIKDGVDTEDLLDALSDIASGIGKASGLPVDFIKGIVDSTEYYEEDETAKGTLRFLGWPDGVLDDRNKRGKSNKISTF